MLKSINQAPHAKTPTAKFQLSLLIGSYSDHHRNYSHLRSSLLSFSDYFNILMAGRSTRNVASNRRIVFITVFSLLAVASFGSVIENSGVYSIEVVKEFRHDPAAFTQGLLYGGNDTLFESTGLNGHSSVRKVNLQTAKIESQHKMNATVFGEGLTLLGERLYQLTWLTKTGFIYDRHDLSKVEKFSHHMKDGWGFATDGKVLFGSDGSSSLYKINPHTMEVIQEHIIKYKDHEVYNLNELEYINNEIWANIWQSDCIVRISPSDGTVTGWVLLQELREGLIRAGYNIDVLNGIAWDADNKRIFVTGKFWPKVYQITLHPHKNPLPSHIEKMCLRDQAILNYDYLI